MYKKVRGRKLREAGLSCAVITVFLLVMVFGFINPSSIIAETPTDITAPTWSNDAVLDAGNVSYTSVTLSWDPAADDVGVTGYRIYNVNDDSLVTTVSETTCKVSSLNAGTDYSFKVEAVDAAGNLSSDGPTVSVTTLTPPDIEAPAWSADSSLNYSNLTQTGVTLNWTPASDNTGVIAYRVYLVYAGRSVISTITDTESDTAQVKTTYDVTNLTANTGYRFQVEACDEAGNWSSGGPMVDILTPLPDEDTGGGSSSSGTMSIALTSPDAVIASDTDDNQTSELGFSVDPDNMHFIWDFSNGIDDGLGINLKNNLSLVTLMDLTTNTQVTLDTGDDADYLTGESTLYVGDFKYTKTNSPEKLRRLELILTSTSLVPGHNYSLTIGKNFMANNGSTLGKNYIWLFQATGVDKVTPAWDDASALTASNIGPKSLVLNWPAADDNVGVMYYRIYQDNTLIATLDGNAASYSVTGLNPNTTYNFAVEAGDNCDNWSSQLTLSETTLTTDSVAPTWPAGSMVTVDSASILTSSLDIDWTAAEDDIGVESYEVYKYDTAAQTETLAATVDSDTLSYHIIGLSPATVYTFRIKALDGYNNASAALESAETTTLAGEADTEAPTWASNAWCSTSRDSGTWHVTFAWGGAADNVGIVGYNVYENDILIATIDDNTTTSYSETMVADGTTHTFSVEAFDAAGNVSTRIHMGAYSPGSDPGDIQRPVWQDGTVFYATNITPDSFTLNYSKFPTDNVGVTFFNYWWGTTEPGITLYGSNNAYDDEGKEIHSIDCSAYRDSARMSIAPNTTYMIKSYCYDAAGNMSAPLSLTLTTPELGTEMSPTTMAETNFGLQSYANEFVNIGKNKDESTTVVTDKITDPVDPNNVNFTFYFPSWFLTTMWTNSTYANRFDEIFDLETADGDSVPIDFTKASAVVSNRTGPETYTFPALTLKPNTDYILKVNPGSYSVCRRSKTKFTITRQYVWKFTTSAGDTEAPSWTESDTLATSKLAPTSITLSWPAASDNIGVTGYNIYQNDVLLASVDGNITTYDITGLSPSTAYTFTVKGTDLLSNESSIVLSANVITPDSDVTVPEWPEGSILTASDIVASGLTLIWTAASDNYEVKGYKVYQDGTEIASVDGTTLTTAVTGLSGNKSYTFKVEAVDEAGNISTTGPTLTQTSASDTTLPTWSEDSSLYINVNDGAKTDMVTLYWNQATDDVGVAGYNIYQDGALVGTTTGKTSTVYDAVNLTQNTKYTFKVEAVDAAGNISTTGPTLVQWTADPDMAITSGKKIACCNNATIGLKDDGTVWGWGDNSYGELGTGTLTSTNTPVPVAGLHNITDIDAGYRFAAALDENGQVWGWGYNSTGQLGNGGDGRSLGSNYSAPTDAIHVIPIKVSGADNAAAISTGMYGLAVLKEDGTIWAAGVGPFGFDIMNNRISHSVMTQLPELDNVAAIRDGYEGLIALRNDKTAWWMSGNDEWVQIPGSGYVGFSGAGNTGYQTGYLIKEDGTICYIDEQGNTVGTSAGCAGTFVLGDTITGVTDVVKVDSDQYYSACVKADGTVWTWCTTDNNSFSALGRDDGNNNTPGQVTALAGENVVDIAVGQCHMHALTSDGKIYSWGANQYKLGTLGDGSATDTHGHGTPVLAALDIASSMDMTYAFVNGDGSQIVVMFNQKVADPGNNLNSFIVSIDGENDAVTAIAVDPADPYQLLLTMAAPITRGSAVSMTYAPGTIKAVNGEGLKAFANYTVRNGIAGTVFYTSPGENAAGVAIDAPIQVSFNKDMYAQSINSDTVYLKKGDTLIPATVTYTSSRKYLTLTPSEPLDYGTTYTVVLTTDVQDAEYLNLAEEYSYSFTTTSLISDIAPNSNTVTPSGIAVDTDLTVSFVNAVNTTTYNNNTVLLQKLDANGDPVTGSDIAVTGTWNKDCTQLTLSHSMALDYASTYRLTFASNMEDVNGQVIGSAANTIDFNTQVCTLASTATMTNNGAACTSLTANDYYKFSTTINNLSDDAQDLKVRIVVRGGRGARLDHGGTVLANRLVFGEQTDTNVYNKYVTVAANGNLTVDLDEISFTDDIVGNVYVDVFVWDSNGLYQAAAPVHYQFPVSE